MRLLLVYPHGNALCPDDGVASRVYGIVKEMLKRGHEVVILHPLQSREKEDLELRAACTMYYYREYSFRGISDWYFTDWNPSYLRAVRTILKKEEIDLIQIEFPWGFFGIWLQTRIPIVYDSAGVEAEFMKITMRHPMVPPVLKPFLPLYGKIYEKLVCHHSTHVITCQPQDRQYYIENYGVKPMTVTALNTVSKFDSSLADRALSKAEARKHLDLPRDKTIVIFHGALPHVPNAEAFDLIRTKIAPAITREDILFVLGGKNTPQYREKNIISLGYLDKIEDLLFAADLAIVPLISGCGMRCKITDYISVGLPFITTEQGLEGLEHIIGSNARVFARVDEAFIEEISKYLGQPDLLARDSKVLKRIFQEHFNLDSFGKKLEVSYTRLLEKGER